MECCTTKESLALFIDGENTKPDFEQLFSLCRSYGEIRVARIYGNRDLLLIPRWQKPVNSSISNLSTPKKGKKTAPTCCWLSTLLNRYINTLIFLPMSLLL